MVHGLEHLQPQGLWYLNTTLLNAHNHLVAMLFLQLMSLFCSAMLQASNCRLKRHFGLSLKVQCVGYSAIQQQDHNHVTLEPQWTLNNERNSLEPVFDNPTLTAEIQLTLWERLAVFVYITEITKAQVLLVAGTNKDIITPRRFFLLVCLFVRKK